MSREKFKAQAKRPQSKTVDVDLFSTAPKKAIENRFDAIERKPLSTPCIRKNFLIRNLNLETIETIKNLTWTENCKNEDSSYSQIIEKAIEVFVQQYDSELIERPEFIKKQEQSKGRKK
ncbi:hypothetical protein [Reichenbachiella ulvae]|uniref:Uncharacterized protein n=1 Tax=Reichenbachiella ulvae TaxID=2980104 RepID=A0ABT3CZP9_9BACT|nr:hypothetical protein [Reichenbachiella ulvae]MCV9389157.1 hypothetical protein [Reichenbachiella ulvae]